MQQLLYDNIYFIISLWHNSLFCGKIQDKNTSIKG